MNLKVDVIKSEEGPALGGAILAAVGCGEYESVEEAAGRLIRVVETVGPDPETDWEIRELLPEIPETLPGFKTIIPGDYLLNKSIKKRSGCFLYIPGSEPRNGNGCFLFLLAFRVTVKGTEKEKENNMKKNPVLLMNFKDKKQLKGIQMIAFLLKSKNPYGG